MEGPSCNWGQYCYNDVEYSIWNTDCGEAFVFIDSGPDQNSMLYCCYCGKPLEIIEYKDEEEIA